MDRKPKLIAIHDLRPVDWVSGKRMPLEQGEGAFCDRCNREHAIVWIVSDAAGRVWQVGSKCGSHLLDGWTPEAEELRDAKKAARNAERAAVAAMREATLASRAAMIVAKLGTLTIPEMHFVRRTESGSQEFWGADGVTVGVAFAKLGPQDPERKAVFARAWLSAKARPVIVATFPDMNSSAVWDLLKRVENMLAAACGVN